MISSVASNFFPSSNSSRQTISSSLEKGKSHWGLILEKVADEVSVAYFFESRLLTCAPLHSLGERHFFLGQIRLYFLLFVFDSYQEVGITFTIYCSSLLKIFSVNYTACFPKNIPHDFLSWWTQFAPLQSKFAGYAKRFAYRLIRNISVIPCSRHGYERTFKLVRWLRL